MNTVQLIGSVILVASASIASAHRQPRSHTKFNWDGQYQQNPQVLGPCASINYSSVCCPPDADDCQAPTGCYCNSDCHIYEDCCDDVYCTSNPTRCRDVGITAGCCQESDEPNTPRQCIIHFRDGIHIRNCSCDISCHIRGDCCDDIDEINCLPRTCAQAGLDPGCCERSCHVRGGSCYCDSICHYYNDCCSDVPNATQPQQCSASIARHRPSELKQKLKAHVSKLERINLWICAQNEKAQVRAVQSVRAQRAREKYARHFRERARSAGHPLA